MSVVVKSVIWTVSVLLETTCWLSQVGLGAWFIKYQVRAGIQCEDKTPIVSSWTHCHFDYFTNNLFILGELSAPSVYTVAPSGQKQKNTLTFGMATLSIQAETITWMSPAGRGARLSKILNVTLKKKCRDWQR